VQPDCRPPATPDRNTPPAAPADTFSAPNVDRYFYSDGNVQTLNKMSAKFNVDGCVCVSEAAFSVITVVPHIKHNIMHDRVHGFQVNVSLFSSSLTETANCRYNVQTICRETTVVRRVDRCLSVNGRLRCLRFTSTTLPRGMFSNDTVHGPVVDRPAVIETPSLQ